MKYVAGADKTKETKSLLSRLCGRYNLGGVKVGGGTKDMFKQTKQIHLLCSFLKAIKWGIDHEEDAVKRFKSLKNLNVEDGGLFLHENGFLGASPDGLVGSDSMLEVRCPYTQRNKTKEEVKQVKKFYMTCINDQLDQRTLSTEHNYYHQVHGNLYATGRTMCYFMVWTPSWEILVEVPKDDTWSPYLYLLEIVYSELMIPHALESCEDLKQ